MRRTILALAAALGLSLAAPATALAGPTIAVSIGLPPIYTVAVPGTNYVFVDGGYRYDEYGRLVWVPAHWRLTTAARPIVVHRPYVAPRPVVVKRPVVVVHDHDRHRGRR